MAGNIYSFRIWDVEQTGFTLLVLILLTLFFVNSSKKTKPGLYQ